MEPEVRVKKQLASFYLGWGELSPRQVLGPPILFCSPAPDTLGEIIGSKLIFQVRKLRPGIAPRESSSSQGSPLILECRVEVGGRGAMFIPRRQRPAGSGKATSGSPQLWWKNSRAAPWWPSAWESSEAFLSPPASPLLASPVPTAVRSR